VGEDERIAIGLRGRVQKAADGGVQRWTGRSPVTTQAWTERSPITTQAMIGKRDGWVHGNRALGTLLQIEIEVRSSEYCSFYGNKEKL
jgi:hypothetical protein